MRNKRKLYPAPLLFEWSLLVVLEYGVRILYSLQTVSRKLKVKKTAFTILY